jgi:hypothetical protein
MPTSSGPENLQASINAANPGDTTVLPERSVYAGDFVLPNKTGAGTITIISSDVAALPPGA